MHAEYVESLVKTCSWLDSQGLSYTLSTQYASFVPTAREWTAVAQKGHDWTAKSFGGERLSCDTVFWIDSDVSWKVDAFEKLLRSELAVVSGLMPISPDGRVGATQIVDGAFTTMTWKDFFMAEGPIKVSGVSLGFVAMKSWVFEKVERPWFKIRSGRVSGFEGEVNVGEDYSFCLNMADAGVEIFVDPEVKVDHHKEQILSI